MRREIIELPLSASVLITGAAGFIGSHLVTRLLELQGYEVVGIDNLSSGSRSNLNEAMSSSRFRFIHGDLLDHETFKQALGNCSTVFHLAADPEVRVGPENFDSHFKQNLQATYNLLEAIRKRNTSTRLIFASTSTVYGEASTIPTPEGYGPLLPISTYGATKLGCEALAASYTELLPVQVVILRFANVVGSRTRHGVIYDFIMKLKKNSNELEVLGDGTQTKSYLHISDCINAFLMILDKTLQKTAIYNIGTEEQTSVLKIARIVTETMGLSDMKIRTSAKQGQRAWPGDVGKMQLDISRIKTLGWNPKLGSDEAVRLAAKELVQELK